MGDAAAAAATLDRLKKEGRLGEDTDMVTVKILITVKMLKMTAIIIIVIKAVIYHPNILLDRLKKEGRLGEDVITELLLTLKY